MKLQFWICESLLSMPFYCDALTPRLLLPARKSVFCIQTINQNLGSQDLFLGSYLQVEPYPPFTVAAGTVISQVGWPEPTILYTVWIFQAPGCLASLTCQNHSFFHGNHILSLLSQTGNCWNTFLAIMRLAMCLSWIRWFTSLSAWILWSWL